MINKIKNTLTRDFRLIVVVILIVLSVLGVVIYDRLKLNQKIIIQNRKMITQNRTSRDIAFGLMLDLSKAMPEDQREIFLFEARKLVPVRVVCDEN